MRAFLLAHARARSTALILNSNVHSSTKHAYLKQIPIYPFHKSSLICATQFQVCTQSSKAPQLTKPVITTIKGFAQCKAHFREAKVRAITYKPKVKLLDYNAIKTFVIQICNHWQPYG